MRKIIIMGAGGRDFHNFNTVFRDDPETEVVAFTATQIPGIDDRRYPASIAGPRCSNGKSEKRRRKRAPGRRFEGSASPSDRTAPARSATTA